MEIKKIHPHFVGEVSGLDLRTHLSDGEVNAIIRGLDEHAVLVFPNQPLTDEALVEFAMRLGPLQGNVVSGQKASNFAHRVSNVGPDGKILPPDDRWRRINEGNLLWHTDGTYMTIGSTYSMLSGRVIPSQGGETEFCDTRAAYDALPERRKKELSNLTARHSLVHSRRLTGFDQWTEQEKTSLARPPMDRPLVQLHPGSKRYTLLLASHIESIAELETEEGRRLVGELTEFATQPEFVYRHRWRVADFVIWDNRSTMHRARPFAEDTEVRDLRAVRVLERTGSAAINTSI